MKFSGIQKTTLIDYPGKVATTLFTYGCNFRCPFCHNPELVIEKEGWTVDEKDVLNFLESRIGKLDGIVITGGEPLLHQSSPEVAPRGGTLQGTTRRDGYGLKSFLEKVKELGFLVKVDTNGYLPKKIKVLDEVVDYWAMDIKNSSDKYSETAGVKVDIENIKKSIKIIMDGDKDYEFRTTVVPGLHTNEDIVKIGKIIKGCKRYTIQNFRSGKTIDKKYKDKSGFKPDDLKKFANSIKPYVKEVQIIEN